MKRTRMYCLCLGLGLATLPPVATGAGAAPNATDVFNRHFATIGGQAAVEKVQTLVVKGTAQERQQAFDFELTLKAPGWILLVARNANGLEVRQGRDTRGRCWRQHPEGVRDLKGQEAGELMDLALGYHLPSQLGLSKTLADAVCEEEREGEREWIAIGKRGVRGVFPRFVFEKRSGLLTRVNEVAFDDYREVNGLRLPFAVRATGETSFRVAKIEINRPIEDKLFDRPAGKEVSTAAEAEMRAVSYQTLISPKGRLDIVRKPIVANFGRGQLAALPSFDPRSPQHWQVDLRGWDLSKLDLSNRLADLLHADFDSRTRWSARLPEGFDRERVIRLGTDPGLGIRKLHGRGITGKGIGLGIIDQTLLVDHVEYRDRLRLYEEIHCPEMPAQMHGPAVASIAVGKTVGVAPAADLYYVAETHGTIGPDRQFDWDFTWLAQSIHRLLDVNASLPKEKKIRVMSISVGWSQPQKGYREAMAAVDRANRDSVFVVSTCIEATHKLAFHGLGREALADPNEFTSFGPGSWWGPMFWQGIRRFAPGQRLLVPMDSRATASPTGSDEYVFYSSGGWSWSVPWISGLYALACQVKPDLTPEVFWAEALKTGRTIRIKQGAEELDFGTIADPVALIESLERAK